MGERQRREWVDAMHGHEREVAQLSSAISRIATTSAPEQAVHQHVVYLTAQIMKHRISMALLAARLGEPAPLVH